jgi:hypothetical protein
MIDCGRLSQVLPKGFDTEELNLAMKQKRSPNFNPHYSYGRLFCKYFFTLSSLVDFLAITPYWIYLGAVHSDLSETNIPIDALRILRLFRVIKVGNRFVTSAKLFYNALLMSVEPLFIMLIIFCLCLFVFGVIFFDLEGGKFTVNADYPSGAFLRVSQDKYTPSPVQSVYDSVPTSIYFTGIVMTTVGYGDLFPYTRAGRAFAVIAAVLGVMFFTLPMSVVASHFDREYTIYERKKRIRADFLKSIDKDVASALADMHTSGSAEMEESKSATEGNDDAAPDSSDGDAHRGNSSARRRSLRASVSERASVSRFSLGRDPADDTENSIRQDTLRQSIAASTTQVYAIKKKRHVRRSVVSTMTLNLVAHKTSGGFAQKSIFDESDENNDGIQMTNPKVASLPTAASLATDEAPSSPLSGPANSEVISEDSAGDANRKPVDADSMPPLRRRNGEKEEHFKASLLESVQYGSIKLSELSRRELEEFVQTLRRGCTSLAEKFKACESALEHHTGKQNKNSTNSNNNNQ